MAPISATVILCAFLVHRAVSAPIGKENFYDQRQNGTHNLQIEIDNIVILHSPIPMQTLLAMMDNAPSDLAMLQHVVQAADKPSTTTEKGHAGGSSEASAEKEEEDDFEDVKVAHEGKRRKRPSLGLGAFLAPLLGLTKHFGDE